MWRLGLAPDPALGEGYMDGRLTLEKGSFWDLLALVGYNAALGRWAVGAAPFRLSTLRALPRLFHQRNSARRSRGNVAHHYDLSSELYDLFLDEDKQYSCAYFSSPDDDLESAQRQKKEHVAKKALLRPGQKVLDIGCGWGGMALHLAREHDVDVTGVTLSEEQLKVARARAAAAGLEDRVRFELTDYRALRGRFDRIVSVGMFEHVGAAHFLDYFRAVDRLLADDGVMLMHSIGRMERPMATSPFIRKHIFPGGYIPALSEVTAALERTALWATDVEILRIHYAETLKEWRRRFMDSWSAARDLYDARFCRMWEAYLCFSEAGFRYGRMMVFQVQIAKTPDGAPLTRDYLMGPPLARDSA